MHLLGKRMQLFNDITNLINFFQVKDKIHLLNIFISLKILEPLTSTRQNEIRIVL